MLLLLLLLLLFVILTGLENTRSGGHCGLANRTPGSYTSRCSLFAVAAVCRTERFICRSITGKDAGGIIVPIFYNRRWSGGSIPLIKLLDLLPCRAPG